MRLCSVAFFSSLFCFLIDSLADGFYFDSRRVCVRREEYPQLVEYRSTHSGEDRCYHILPFRMKKGSEYTMDNVKMLCEHYDTQVVRVEDDKDATFFKEAFLHLFKKTSKGAAKRRYDLALIYLSANETTGVAGEGWCNFLTVFLNGSAKLETLPCSDKEFGNKSLTNSHICWRTNTVGDDDMSPQEKVNIKINGEKSTASVGEEQLETTVYGILETETTTQNSTTEPPSPPLKPVWKVVLAMGIGILTIYSTSALVLVYLTEEKLYYERQLAVQLVENKPEQ